MLDLLVLPNDNYLISSCVEGNISIYKINWDEKKFDLVGDYDLNKKFVSSVICEPNFTIQDSEMQIKLATQVSKDY